MEGRALGRAAEASAPICLVRERDLQACAARAREAAADLRVARAEAEFAGRRARVPLLAQLRSAAAAADAERRDAAAAATAAAQTFGAAQVRLPPKCAHILQQTWVVLLACRHLVLRQARPL